MPRERYRRRTGSLPGEGGQGREAPKGSLDGPVQNTPSLITGAVGSDEPDGPQLDLGDGGPGTVPVTRARNVQDGCADDGMEWYQVWWFGGLTDEQSDGLACVVCGQSLLSWPGVRPQAWVPVGWSETLSQVFACVGACARIAQAESGARPVKGCVSHE